MNTETNPLDPVHRILTLFQISQRSDRLALRVNSRVHAAFRVPTQDAEPQAEHCNTLRTELDLGNRLLIYSRQRQEPICISV